MSRSRYGVQLWYESTQEDVIRECHAAIAYRAKHHDGKKLPLPRVKTQRRLRKWMREALALFQEAMREDQYRYETANLFGAGYALMAMEHTGVFIDFLEREIKRRTRGSKRKPWVSPTLKRLEAA